MAYRGGDRATVDRRTGSFKPYDPGEGKYFTDYDLAKAFSRSTVMDKRAQPRVPSFDRTCFQHRGCRQLREELEDAPRRPDEAGERFRLDAEQRNPRSPTSFFLTQQAFSESPPPANQGRQPSRPAAHRWLPDEGEVQQINQIRKVSDSLSVLKSTLSPVGAHFTNPISASIQRRNLCG